MASVAIEADHDRREKQDQICALADEVDTGDGVVIVTDIYGGSPSNLALPACRGDDRKIIYGMNLPVLVKLAKSRHLPLRSAISASIDAGRKYLDSMDGE
jgi:PTS system mannose-specific IIA component